MSVTVIRNHRQRGLVWSVLVVVLAALLAAACGGDDDPPSATADPTSTTRDVGTRSTERTKTTTSTTIARPTTTATTRTSVPPPEQAVIDRYVGYWDARFAANSGTPDPQDPALAEYATGAQLVAVIAETKKNLDAGLAFRPRMDPANIRRVSVISLDGNRAVVQECFVDDGLVVRRDTGAIVNDTIATHNVRGELERVDGVWRVSKAQLVQRWKGIAGCARGL